MHGSYTLLGPDSVARATNPNLNPGHLNTAQVVAVYGSWHLGQLQVGLSRAVRVQQAARVELIIEAPVPMQVWAGCFCRVGRRRFMFECVHRSRWCALRSTKCSSDSLAHGATNSPPPMPPLPPFLPRSMSPAVRPPCALLPMPADRRRALCAAPCSCERGSPRPSHHASPSGKAACPRC